MIQLRGIKAEKLILKQPAERNEWILLSTFSVHDLFTVGNAEVIPFSTAAFSWSCLACSLETNDLPTTYSFTLCQTNQMWCKIVFMPSLLGKKGKLAHCDVATFNFLEVGPSSGHTGLNQVLGAALLRRTTAGVHVIITDVLQQVTLGHQQVLMSLKGGTPLIWTHAPFFQKTREV